LGTTTSTQLHTATTTTNTVDSRKKTTMVRAAVKSLAVYVLWLFLMVLGGLWNGQSLTDALLYGFGIPLAVFLVIIAVLSYALTSSWKKTSKTLPGHLAPTQKEAEL
jgi:hypothetical protein